MSFLYFVFIIISMSGIFLTSLFFRSNNRNEESLKFDLLTIIKIWILFYLIALFTEWLGHSIGIWTWSDIYLIFLHAAVWWANVLTLSVICLTPLKKCLRYVIFLVWVLTFEYLQELFVHKVTHYPLLGNPCLMITIVMLLVSAIMLFTPEFLQSLGLMK
ncbi:MAG: hypothetical protein ACTSR8_01125 [Promethearchaeota archaeon]